MCGEVQIRYVLKTHAHRYTENSVMKGGGGGGSSYLMTIPAGALWPCVPEPEG